MVCPSGRYAPHCHFQSPLCPGTRPCPGPSLCSCGHTHETWELAAIMAVPRGPRPPCLDPAPVGAPQPPQACLV